MPMMGKLAWDAIVRFCDRPWAPQSMPWSLASVATDTVALLRAVTADAGASKMYGLFCGSGQVPSVTAVSRLTMRSWVPEKSCGMVGPSAVEGFLVRLVPTAPAKWTSPPKPSVTVLPLPVQSGLGGEGFGKCSAVATAWWVVAGALGGVLEPPVKKAK